MPAEGQPRVRVPLLQSGRMPGQAVKRPRTNSEWISDLRTPGPAREAALGELREILVSGLHAGLSGWVDTSAAAFDPLAEDFAQETLLKVLDHLDSFEGRSQFTTWAHKIAIRVALTELRRQRWQDKSLDSLLEVDGEEVTPGWIADPALGPEGHTEKADLWARLQRVLIEELTDKQRSAMMAVGIQGMPVEEVARRMGTERNALYKLLHDARLRLKHRLAREGLSSDDFFSEPM